MTNPLLYYSILICISAIITFFIKKIMDKVEDNPDDFYYYNVKYLEFNGNITTVRLYASSPRNAVKTISRTKKCRCQKIISVELI